MGELRAHPFMPKRDAILQQLVRMLSMSPEVIQSDLRAACNARRQTVRLAVAEMVDLELITAERRSHKVTVLRAVRPLTLELVEDALLAARIPMRKPPKSRAKYGPEEREMRRSLRDRIAGAFAEGFEPLRPEHNCVRVVDGRKVAGRVGW